MTNSDVVTWCVAAVLAAASSGCSGGESPGGEAAEAPPGPATGFVDSLVLTAPQGQQIWFTDGREARDEAGARCIERVMEIRTPLDTFPVPLLYTGEAPTVVDDSTLRARVWLDCQGRALYHVSVHTGRPSLVEP